MEIRCFKGNGSEQFPCKLRLLPPKIRKMRIGRKWRHQSCKVVVKSMPMPYRYNATARARTKGARCVEYLLFWGPCGPYAWYSRKIPLAFHLAKTPGFLLQSQQAVSPASADFVDTPLRGLLCEGRCSRRKLCKARPTPRPLLAFSWPSSTETLAAAVAEGTLAAPSRIAPRQQRCHVV